MTTLAPNLHHQFLELPAEERFAAAAASGFDVVEWHFPYELSKAELKARVDDAGQSFAYAVVPSDWSAGDYGLAGQPGREDEFRRAADRAIEYALHVGFRSLQVPPGTLPPGMERNRCIDTLLANLDYMLGQTHGTALQLCLEGVCDARFPGKRFILRTIAEAASVVTAINRQNVRLVYDTYHLRMQEAGSLSDILDLYYPLIGHVQIGNAPIRNEPGVGELDLFFLLGRLAAKGYDGPIGLEYDPSLDTWASLLWAERYGYQVSRPPRAEHLKRSAPPDRQRW